MSLVDVSRFGIKPAFEQLKLNQAFCREREPQWGSTVSVECVDNYQMVGSNILRCEDNFKYRRPLPKCVPVDGCDVPRIGKHSIN